MAQVPLNNQSNTYTVKAGDTLNTIAKQQGFTNWQQAGISGFKSGNPDLIQPGEQLSISGTPVSNNAFTSSSAPRKEFAKNSVDIQSILNTFGVQQGQQAQAQQQKPPKAQGEINAETYSDPYTQMLDKLSGNSDIATKNLIQNIKSQKQGQEMQVNDEIERYKQGLQLLGIQTGNAQFTPDIVMGNVMQAENQRMQKLQELDRNEASAVLEATMARDEKDFRLLKDRMDYIKEVKRERLNVLKDSYDMLKSEQGIADIQAEQIYDQLQKLTNDADKMTFIQEISSRFGIPPGAIVSSIAEIKREREKDIKKTGSKKTSVSIGTFSTKMEGIKGEDGFIDPGAWFAARSTWLKNNGTLSAFNSNFKIYLNPLSYEKAGFPKDKNNKSKSS